MTLESQQFIDEVLQHSSGRPLWLAYSGGVDSHVLLHLLAHSSHSELKQCQVVHVNHGLHAHAADWAEHCAAQAAAYGLSFQCLNVIVTQQEQLGLEAAARQARYQAIADLIGTEAVLLTAQHQQDQAETLMLQLLRGAGPKGLAAMSYETELMGMTILRPLLHTSKLAIYDYAVSQQLQWIDDPSNSDTQINRNYLRHEIWPQLQQRWPGVSATLARSAAHCAETEALAETLAELDCERLGIKRDKNHFSITALLSLPHARQRNLLRYLLTQFRLPMPSTAVLQRILDEVCQAEADKQPLVSWHGGEARRFQQQLYLLPPLQRPELQTAIDIDDIQPLQLSDGRTVEWVAMQGAGIKKAVILSGITLRFRQGGERIQLQGQPQHKSLKHLLQQWQVPPWERPVLPLFFQQQSLIAIAGLGLSAEVAVATDEIGYMPVVKRAE